MADMSLKITFRPIDVWPKPKTLSPKDNPFRPKRGGWNALMPWTDTMDLLTRELSQINATDIVIQLDLTETQIRQDGLPRSDAKVRGHHGVIISFRCKHGHMRFITDRYRHWQVNVRAIAKVLEALRMIERYEVTSDGEQYRGYLAIEETSGAGATQVDLGKALISKHGGVTQALKATHPDKGGTRDEFEAVQAARQALG